MKKLLVAIAVLLLGAGPSLAQSTKAQINTEITSTFIDNTVGAITPTGLRAVTSDIVNSIMPTAPVVANNLACFNGTTGLLKDCASAPTPNAITALTGDITATGPGSVAATLATVNANVGSFGDATTSATVTVNAKGLVTAASSQTVTPAVGSITGLGTGVATALGNPVTGSGGPALTTNAALVTPNIGVATATSVNKVAVTAPATSATLTIANGTTLTTTTSTSVGAGQYLGEPSTGNATAGNVGEYTESILASGSAVSLVNNIGKTVTSITLGAGDWDISGNISFTQAGTTSVTGVYSYLSVTTNTIDLTPGRAGGAFFAAAVPGAGTSYSIPVGPQRFSLSGSTTIFLVASSNFTVSTQSAFGIIRARRAR